MAKDGYLGATAPGTKHKRLFRKSTVGHKVPVDHVSAPMWGELVVPGPPPTGVKRPFKVEGAGVQSKVLTESKNVQGPVIGQPSRRARRAAARAAARAERGL